MSLISNYRSRNIRVRDYERQFINSLKRDISSLENRDVKTPEIMRRICNIPNLKTILSKDAMMKRRVMK